MTYAHDDEFRGRWDSTKNGITLKAWGTYPVLSGAGFRLLLAGGIIRRTENGVWVVVPDLTPGVADLKVNLAQAKERANGKEAQSSHR